MKTVLTALTTLGICSGARRRLEQNGFPQRTSCGGRVKLTTVWNKQGAFGLKLKRELLAVLSAAALVLVWTQRKRGALAAGLILGGGLSNLIERLFHGKVYDYIQFPKAPWKLKKYVFNLADFAIFIGGILLTLGRRK